MKRACMDCGTNYESVLTCCCPECGSGVINQLCMDDVDVFKRKSYVHKTPKNYLFRTKNNPVVSEFVSHTVEEYTFIEDYEQSPVTIDYLCFTVKLADFRHCKKESPYSGIHFPVEPVFSTHQAQSFSDIEAYNHYFRAVYSDYLLECVRRFIQYVLGFNYGAPRGYGFQFYQDSFVLTSANGDDYCGQVGIGGNRDTVHFQIPAHGCKHLFAQRSCRFLHHWLGNILCCKQLTRIDLAFDCYDDLHTCEAAERAATLGAFKRSRGFAPIIKIVDEYQIVDGRKVFTREERNIGSRQSLVYWRIYNKKLEQNIQAENFSWYRSEVELKKWDIDILLNPVGGFVGLNAYAASLISEDITPVKTQSKRIKRASCDVLASAFWAKRQYGRLINSLLDLYQGDSQKVVSTLVKDDVYLPYPSMHQKLINALE